MKSHYILYGNDSVSIKAMLRSITTKHIVVKTSSFSEAIEAYSQKSLIGSTAVLLTPGKTSVDYLRLSKMPLNPDNVFVLLYAPDKRKKGWKALEAISYVYEYNVPKPWQKDKIIALIKQNKTPLESKAAEILVDAFSNDVEKINQEIEKLSLAYDVIEVEHVMHLKAKQDLLFQLVNFVITRKPKEFHKAWVSLSEPDLKLSAILISQLKSFIKAALGDTSNYWATKAPKVGKNRLTEVLKELVLYQENLKSGVYTDLYSVLLSLCL